MAIWKTPTIRTLSPHLSESNGGIKIGDNHIATREPRRALFHENAHMGLNGGGQRFQVVASFKNGNQATLAVLLCDGFDDAREPSIPLLA